MSFVRELSPPQMQKLQSGENAEKFSLLKADVLAGKVFPAVRKNELHFYYKGGCLYRFAGGAFRRDPNYEKFGKDLLSLPPYEREKIGVERRFLRADGRVMERQLLDALYCHTFDGSYGGDCVVLDIEVDLNGAVARGKKCDLVLLNRRKDELVFVEGKVFSDGRVLVAQSFTPEVIAQVNAYTQAISEQRQTILEQYARHIEIINELFGCSYRPPRNIVEPSKLLVYETPKTPTRNAAYTIGKINTELGANNVLWVAEGERPALDEIYFALTR